MSGLEAVAFRRVPHQRGTGAAEDGPTRPLRFVVVDDQRNFAELLALALRAEPDLDCVGMAFDPDEARAVVAAAQPDLVVLDVQFDRHADDGVDLAADLRARHPGLRVVLLTGQTEASLVTRAARAGVSCLMPKNGNLADLLAALRSVPEHGLVVAPRMLSALVAESVADPAPATSTLPPLSRRERDVLSMLGLGMDVRTIADHLGITLNTCRSYVRTLMGKLDAHSQLEAVAIARRHGLADVEAV